MYCYELFFDCSKSHENALLTAKVSLFLIFFLFLWQKKLIVTDYLFRRNRNIRLREDNRITFVTCKTGLLVECNVPYVYCKCHIQYYEQNHTVLSDHNIILKFCCFRHVFSFHEPCCDLNVWHKTIRIQITVWNEMKTVWYLLMTVFVWRMFHRWMQKYDLSPDQNIDFFYCLIAEYCFTRSDSETSPKL